MKWAAPSSDRSAIGLLGLPDGLGNLALPLELQGHVVVVGRLVGVREAAAGRATARSRPAPITVASWFSRPGLTPPPATRGRGFDHGIVAICSAAQPLVGPLHGTSPCMAPAVGLDGHRAAVGQGHRSRVIRSPNTTHQHDHEQHRDHEHQAVDPALVVEVHEEQHHQGGLGGGDGHGDEDVGGAQVHPAGPAP